MPVLWIDDGVQTGAANMARDHALWRGCEEGQLTAPVIRVYQWKPAAVSIGHHQSTEQLDFDALRRDKVSVVRRPTGGGAVLHDEELTFAVAAPLLRGERRETAKQAYAVVSDALVATLRSFGVDAKCRSDGRAQAQVCFSSTLGHEITVGGRKLVGSALRRGRRSFLIHGSILLGDGHCRLLEYLKEPGVDAATLRARCVDLGSLGVQPGRRDLAAALANALTASRGGKAVPLVGLPACTEPELALAKSPRVDF